VGGIDFLLDTSVVIGLLKGDAETIALIDSAGCTLPDSAVSQVTRMELLSAPGLQAADEKQVLSFLDACMVIPLSEAIEKRAVSIRKSQGLGLCDAVIVATAAVNDLQLVTHDERLQRFAASFAPASSA
jgi:predicted nucleic acid-binding protein